MQWASGAFDVEVARILTDRERRQFRTIVEYLKRAPAHFVDLIEPLPPLSRTSGSWVSAIGETTDLH